MIRWIGLVLALLLTACASQQGGGECLCPTSTVVLPATWTPISTVTPAPSPTGWTPTVPPTPTRLPPLPTWTGTEVNPECAIAPGAAPIKPLLDYWYTDPNNSRYWQNIRSGPGTQYTIVAKLPPGNPRLAHWISGPWVALTPDCIQWVYTPLGTLLPHSTD